MQDATADGAAAAAEFFLSHYPYIYATGDTTSWRAMSAPTCTFCTDAAQDAEARYQEGVRGGTPIEVVSARGLELKAGEWYSADLRVIQPPTIETSATGEQTQTSEGGTFDFNFALTWNGEWVIDSVGVLPVEGA